MIQNKKLSDKINLKLYNLIELNNKNEYNDFYDYLNKIKKGYTGWSLLENTEKKIIQNIIYKIFNEKEVRKTVGG